jgi:outer membrane cobalamin receptor
VENVADKDYSQALGFPSPGRTLIGGLSFDF